MSVAIVITIATDYLVKYLENAEDINNIVLLKSMLRMLL